jgi:hypothetical protein
MTASSLARQRSHVAAALDRLACLNREAEARFRHAADRAGVDSLCAVLGRWARERARFAHELEIEAQALGERQTWTGGSAPRVRSPQPQNDAQRIEICRDADATTLVEYERTLLLTLPDEIERMVRGHHSAIKDARDRMAQIGNGIA